MPPQPMVMARFPAEPVAPLTYGHHEAFSTGWARTGQDVGLGTWEMPTSPPPPPPRPMSLNVPQSNGQVMGGAIVGTGGSGTATTSPPGRPSISYLGGRGAVGSSVEGSATPPVLTGIPTSRTSVDSDSIPREIASGNNFAGVRCNGSSGRSAATPGLNVTSVARPTAPAANYDHPGVDQLSLRRTPSLNDSTFINLANKTHIWAFGAAAELLHNSSDAKATEVRVSLEDLGPERETNFVVIDDGCGMTNSEMGQMFALGKDYGYGSTAPADERIGCNGFGFKQGVLRLGDTAVVVSVRGEPGRAGAFGELSVPPR